MRVAESWLNDYKYLFYHASQLHNININVGHFKQTKEIQSRLQCQSFKWYRENIFPDLRFII